MTTQLFSIDDATVEYSATLDHIGNVSIDDVYLIDGGFIDPKKIFFKEGDKFISLEEKLKQNAEIQESKISDFEEHSVWNKTQLGVI
jgi:hypothetical protein